MKKALIITGKFVQDPEFIYPYYRLLEEGYDVVVATEDGKETFGVAGTKVIVNTTTDNLNTDDYDILVLPGGARALEYIRQNKKVIDFIHEFDAKGKVIACICHGAQLLISAKIVKGRKVSGYYSLKDDIENAGAHFADEPAVIDKNLVTTAHYKFMGPWMKAALDLARKEQ
jgi:protease I